MNILAIDSTAVAASAALLEDGKLLGETFLNVGLTHSCTLLPMIEALLHHAGVAVQDVDLFVVTNGPGSFTGVRIGVATIKGMAFPTDKPCVGVSTLHALAYNLQHADGYLCCAMDARCGQVYTAIFEAKNGAIRRVSPDQAISIEELGDQLKSLEGRIFFIGDGAEICYEALKETLPDAALAPIHLRYQRASSAGVTVWAEHWIDNAVGADALEVSYLRLSQAERERNQKLEAQKNDSSRV